MDRPEPRKKAKQPRTVRACAFGRLVQAVSKKEGGGVFDLPRLLRPSRGTNFRIISRGPSRRYSGEHRVYLRGGGLGVASKQIVYQYHRVWPEALRSRVKHLFPRGLVVALYQDRQLNLGGGLSKPL